jgi:hypothetical protein
VLKTRMLRGIFGPKRDKAIGRWKELNNEKLRDLYPSPNIIRFTKQNNVRWTGNEVRMADHINT